MKTLYVNWYGPYTREEIMRYQQCNDVVNEDLHREGLYLILGKPMYAQILRYYIGKTETEFAQRYLNHQKLDELYRERRIYLGKIVDPRQDQKENIDLAEWMYIYFSENETFRCANEKKTVNPPRDDCSIITLFYKRNGQEYERVKRNRRIILPEFMRWDAQESTLYYAERLARYRLEQ